MVKKPSKKKAPKVQLIRKQTRKGDEKLDEIIALEKRLLKEEKKIEGEEKKIETEENSEKNKEKKIEDILEKEESDIEKLEKIEKEIKTKIEEHPLAKVTFKDLTKGMIGAFIGLAIHYT
ncbi:MAG: hypothetical protein ACP5NW_02340, partial [Candidatus Woesearchaeota archaeon]